MTPRKYSIFICAVVLAFAGDQVFASAPQPIKGVGIGMYSGRWYEIGKIVKVERKTCPRATEDFATDGPANLTVTLTCHPTDASPRQITAHVAIIPRTGNAKLKMSFFGGLVHQEYWMLDHASDQSWALMATPGGGYLWLLARRPALDDMSRAEASARIQALGYDISRFVFDR